MPLMRVESLDHPELEVYANLKQTNRTRWTGQFIAEGVKLVQRLLDSDFGVHSVMVTEKELPLIEPHLQHRTDVPVYLVPRDLASQLIGFEFHCGLMGCGHRKPNPRLDEIIPATGPVRIVICPRIENADNLGAILRMSAGFGVQAVLLGFGSVDPYMRRTLRVSMGAGFQIPIIESGHDLTSHLRWLRDERGVELIATVLDETAVPLKQSPISDRCGLLFGNEQHGLSREWIDLCQQRVTLPMAAGTDSLNVAFAAGIFMYHYYG